MSDSSQRRRENELYAWATSRSAQVVQRTDVGVIDDPERGRHVTVILSMGLVGVRSEVTQVLVLDRRRLGVLMDQLDQAMRMVDGDG